MSHGPLLFSALKAAMAEPGRAADPLLAREYSKLFTAASKVAEVRRWCDGAASVESCVGIRQGTLQGDTVLPVVLCHWAPPVSPCLAAVWRRQDGATRAPGTAPIGSLPRGTRAQLPRLVPQPLRAGAACAQVFTVRERNQLEVYGTWAVLRNQLTTDDSFQFNKARLPEQGCRSLA